MKEKLNKSHQFGKSEQHSPTPFTWHVGSSHRYFLLYLELFCSEQLLPSPLPAPHSTFSPAQRNAVTEHADVLLLFSAAEI